MGELKSQNWRPIEDLPSDWRMLASQELRSLSDVWTDQKALLEGSDALRQFNDRLQRQWAIETGILERIYSLDRGVTEVLIERGIDSSLIPNDSTDKDPELVTRIIRDQESAVDWLFDIVNGQREFSLSFIKELHALMTRYQNTASGRDQFGHEVELPLLRGMWKELPNNPTRPDGSLHEYCPPEQVAPEMERLLHLHQIHEELGVSPELEAAWLHHRFTQVHPFQDGNGRIARALASLVLIRAGWFPLVVTRDDRERYIYALELADQGDLTSLALLIASLQRKSFVNALGLAREVLQESERLDQMIASVKDMYARRDERLREDWEHAKNVADKVFGLATERFEELATRLRSEVGQFSSEFGFFVINNRNGGERMHWYRWQTFEIANRLGYFANMRDYRAWVRLRLVTDGKADIVLQLSAIGKEYRGLIGASLFFFRKEETEGTEEQVRDISPASDELFQINYKEDEGSVLDRFGNWLDRALIRALEMWRQGL